MLYADDCITALVFTITIIYDESPSSSSMMNHHHHHDKIGTMRTLHSNATHWKPHCVHRCNNIASVQQHCICEENGNRSVKRSTRPFSMGRQIFFLCIECWEYSSRNGYFIVTWNAVEQVKRSTQICINFFRWEGMGWKRCRCKMLFLLPPDIALTEGVHFSASTFCSVQKVTEFPIVIYDRKRNSSKGKASKKCC